MPIAKLILVRHGATEWSANGRHTSRTDLPLTPEGVAEAEQLKHWLAAQQPARVWCSPLRRARETAAACGFDGPHIVDALREWDYGDFEGLTTPQIQQQVPGWNVFTHGGGQDGETPEQMCERIDTLIECARGSDDAPIVAFAHGHSLRALAARWMGLPISAGARLSLHSGRVGLLDYEHDQGALAGWNLAPAT